MIKHFKMREIEKAFYPKDIDKVIRVLRLVLVSCFLYLLIVMWKASFTHICAISMFVIMLLSILYSNYTIYKLYIKAVCRGCNGKNRDLYKKHKSYFDKQFQKFHLLSKH